MAEKQRRDNLNAQIATMATLVPTVASGGSRKKDKISVLRLTAAHLRTAYSECLPRLRNNFHEIFFHSFIEGILFYPGQQRILTGKHYSHDNFFVFSCSTGVPERGNSFRRSVTWSGIVWTNKFQTNYQIQPVWTGHFFSYSLAQQKQKSSVHIVP